MTTVREDVPSGTKIQDHAAYLEGSHDFQIDIERFANNETVATILRTVMLATGVRFAAVARVTEDRWVACRSVDEVNFGLKAGDEIEIQSTFCQTVRDTREVVIFSDVHTDEIYRRHPIAMKFGIVSYASVPIFRKNGAFFGTLCGIDTTQRDLKNPRVVEMFKMFADIIGRSLDAEEQLEAQEALLQHQRRLARVQEEFVAILGHDLRSPMAAFEAGMRQLSKSPDPERIPLVIDLMRAPLQRMKELIANLLLHAKARLGEGLTVTPVSDAPLEAAIRSVANEISAAAQDRKIALDVQFDRPVRCDPNRIAQAVANLLSNAVAHGEAEREITLQARCDGKKAMISVSNYGEPIPPEMRETLFDPFRRGPNVESDGLGLGLNIAASIAQAHGGRIEVDCADGITCFKLVLPQES